jgi:hypothetical protein
MKSPSVVSNWMSNCSGAACIIGAASGEHSGPRRGRETHFHAALFVLHGELLMKYTEADENDFTAHG